MSGTNKVILLGHATCDAEQRQTRTGKAVSNIRLATSRAVGGREETQFRSIVCWDKLAETTVTCVKKGDPHSIEWRRQYRTFQAEKGKARGA